MSEQALLVEGVSEQYVALYLYAATLTMQVYDNFLTLDEEFTYIWSSEWSAIKGVFLIVRYLSTSIYLYEMISSKLLSDSVCSVAKWVVGLGGMFVGAAADVFLAYRVYAIYGRNKHILILLIALFIGWEIAIFSLGIIFLPLYRTALDPIPQVNTLLGKNCITVDYPHKIAAIWIGMLSYQSILFTFLLLKVIRDQYRSWRLGLQYSPLYIVFVRDGLWAYFLIVVILVFCVISAFKAQGLGDTAIMLLITTTTICCCRLILNLRSTASKQVFHNSLQPSASLASGRHRSLSTSVCVKTQESRILGSSESL